MTRNLYEMQNLRAS